MTREELTSDGVIEVQEIVDKATKSLYDKGLHALERAPISDGIQFIRNLQQESGGFSLMPDHEATPLMTGYALLAMGEVGIEISDPAPSAASKYLAAIQLSSGGFGYFVDSGPSLGPTAIIAQALKSLGAPLSNPILKGCQRYLASNLKEGMWRETFSMDGESDSAAEIALTSMCVSALGDALLSTQRQEIIDQLVASRNHDGGWGWSAEHDSDVDHTALSLMALVELSQGEDTISPDLRVALEQGRAFLLSCQQDDGGFSQRSGRGQPSTIDRSGFAVYALAKMGSPTEDPIRRAAGFFLRVQNSDGGWGDNLGSASDLDSTVFVLQALMSAGERIITIHEVEESLAGLKSEIVEVFQEKVCCIADERDDLTKELKESERMVRILQAAVGAIVTVAALLLGIG